MLRPELDQSPMLQSYLESSFSSWSFLFLTSQDGVKKHSWTSDPQPVTSPSQEGTAAMPLNLGYPEGSCEPNTQLESFCGLTPKGTNKNMTILGPNKWGFKAEERKGGSGGCTESCRLGLTERVGWSGVSVPRPDSESDTSREEGLGK